MKQKSSFHSAWLIVAMGVFIISFMFPLMAQDDSNEDAPIEDILIAIRGLVEILDDDEIVVDGVIVAPAGAFNPSELEIGDEVIVVGYLLNDDTIKAEMLIVVDEDFDECSEYGNGEGCEVEVTPEVTPEATLEVTPEITPEATPEITPEATEPPVYETCVPESHPVANAIADEFGVDVAFVIDLHCQGYGFGNITRAFLLVDEYGYGGDVASLLAQARDGGWGVIFRDSGVHPSDLAQGRVLRGRGNQNNDEETTTDTTTDTDNNNGNSNGNCNNGNGNG
ncbi:MAG TPA: hypothetical protein PLZ51_24220, partial [Aggregatilineales bacterium]|nr:hypothetical protein [Aggregatilineales bacterium]